MPDAAAGQAPSVLAPPVQAAPPRAAEPGGLACALLAFGLCLPIVFAGSGLMDEVTLLSHAMRVRAGQVIYRDFFEFLAPLSAWLPALLFGVVAPTLQALRVLTAAAIGLAAWQMYHVTRRLDVPAPVAALPGLLLAGALYAAVPGYSHHWILQPFLWGAVLAASTGVATGAPRSFALAGVGVGLTGLTLQLDGAVLGVALALWLVLDGWAGGTPWRRVGARLAALAAGVALPLGLALGYLAWHGALGAFVDHVWVWALAHYKTAGGINDVKFLTDLAYLLQTALPDFKLWKWYLNAGFILYAYALPIGLTALVLARAADLVAERMRGGPPWPLARARLALVALVTLGCFAALVKGKADSFHVFYYLPSAAVLATALAWRFRALVAGAGRLAVSWLPLASLVGFGLAGAALAASELVLKPELQLRADGPDGRLRADAATLWLRTHARPGDRLAVFPLGAQFYVYALPPASRFTSMLDPAEGYYDRADYERFWAELARERPRFVMLAPISREAPPPRMPLAGYRQVAALAITYMGKPARALIYARGAGSQAGAPPG